MLRFKYWIKDFFGFSRSQVNGFIVLLILVIVMQFSEPLWQWWIRTHPSDYSADSAMLDSLVALWDTEKNRNVDRKESQPITLDLFYFDPNNVADSSLISLGFSQPIAKRIIRYREKGGKFLIKSDLLKIYGIDSTFYQRIHSFIRLPERLASSQTKGKPSAQPVFNAKKAIEKFDLNYADTAQLKKIYGIGKKLSLRIVKYREALGGFTTMDQLKEIYGLDSLVIKRLIENATLQNDFQLKKINLNTASEKQLGAHPYLRKIAKALVSYRFQHGDFKAVGEIRNVTNIEEKTIEKIIPYLKVNDEP
jgi:DNA uptake protein ComE-like DNA-binding protein